MKRLISCLTAMVLLTAWTPVYAQPATTASVTAATANTTGPVHLSGAITDIGDSQIWVSNVRGQWVVNIDHNTQFQPKGEAGFNTLNYRKGDNVYVEGRANSASTIAASLIVNQSMPFATVTITGQVALVTGNFFTMTIWSGNQSKLVSILRDTMLFEGGNAVTSSHLATGSIVKVTGDDNQRDNILRASRVDIGPF